MNKDDLFKIQYYLLKMIDATPIQKEAYQKLISNISDSIWHLRTPGDIFPGIETKLSPFDIVLCELKKENEYELYYDNIYFRGKKVIFNN